MDPTFIKNAEALKGLNRPRQARVSHIPELTPEQQEARAKAAIERHELLKREDEETRARAENRAPVHAEPEPESPPVPTLTTEELDALAKLRSGELVLAKPSDPHTAPLKLAPAPAPAEPLKVEPLEPAPVFAPPVIESGAPSIEALQAAGNGATFPTESIYEEQPATAAPEPSQPPAPAPAPTPAPKGGRKGSQAAP